MAFSSIFISSVAISILVIPVMWRLAPRLGMLDTPDARKVHTMPIPRIGGWGIVLGTLCSVLAWAPLNPLIQTYVFGSLVMFATGVMDDRRGLGHYKKFLAQLLAVAPVVLYAELYVHKLPLMGQTTLPPELGIPFTVFAMIGAINAINHSDGLDGLAAGQSLLSLIAIALIAHFYGGSVAVVIAVAAIGGVLGFLLYNNHPARIFMGDAGSLFLGFTLAFLIVLLTQRVNPTLSPALTVPLLGLPIIDILAVLGQRVYYGLNWFRATRNHLHHRLLDLGCKHSTTVSIIYLIQAYFVIGAIYLMNDEADLFIMVWYLGSCAIIYALVNFARHTGWRAPDRGDALYQTAQYRHFWSRYVLTPAPVFFAAVGMIVFMGAQGLSKDLFILAIVATAVALVTRFTPERKLIATPMDYLLVLVVVTIAIFCSLYFQEQQLTMFVIKGVIVLYICELILNRIAARWSIHQHKRTIS